MDRASGGARGGAAEGGGGVSGALGAVQSYLGGLVGGLMPSVHEDREVCLLGSSSAAPIAMGPLESDNQKEA